MNEEQYMVVMESGWGRVIATANDENKPAVYVHASDAELRCAYLREHVGAKWGVKFNVLPFRAQ